eukprot:scaffold78688_cov59-Cyclotella_meneghiniana.AAC.5
MLTPWPTAAFDSLPTRQTMSRQSSFRPIDPPTAEVSVGTSHPPSQAARAAADGVSVMMSSASAPTSTHPGNPSQEYLDFMAQCGFTNERVKKSRPMWEVLSCMCLNSERCKQLVRGWKELGESHAHMLEYVGSTLYDSSFNKSILVLPV